MIRRAPRYGKAQARPWQIKPGTGYMPGRGGPPILPKAPASQRIDQESVARTHVVASRAVVWNVRKHVTATRAVRWNVRKRVTSVRAIRWAVRARVTAARLIRWFVHARVVSVRRILWKVRARVVSLRRLVWGTHARVYVARAVRWSVRARVQAVRSLSWVVRAHLTAARAVRWAVQSRLSAARALRWQVEGRPHPVSTRTVSWTVEGVAAPEPEIGGWIAPGLPKEEKPERERVKVVASLTIGWSVEAPTPPHGILPRRRERAALTRRRRRVREPSVFYTAPDLESVRRRDEDEAVAILLSVME